MLQLLNECLFSFFSIGCGSILVIIMFSPRNLCSGDFVFLGAVFSGMFVLCLVAGACRFLALFGWFGFPPVPSPPLLQNLTLRLWMGFLGLAEVLFLCFSFVGGALLLLVALVLSFSYRLSTFVVFLGAIFLFGKFLLLVHLFFHCFRRSLLLFLVLLACHPKLTACMFLASPVILPFRVHLPIDSDLPLVSCMAVRAGCLSLVSKSLFFGWSQPVRMLSCALIGRVVCPSSSCKHLLNCYRGRVLSPRIVECGPDSKSDVDSLTFCGYEIGDARLINSFFLVFGSVPT